MKTREKLIAAITEYFSTGGLVNPEMMDHDIVSDLLFDCRELLLSMKPNQQNTANDL